MSPRRRAKSSQSAENDGTDRSWRDFEKLVSRIEEALAPQGAIVTSPDRIPDKITGESREVDASVRYRVGTVDILIIVECRERKRVQDSLWIEQLATKQRDVGAAKCVAVTSSGFSNSAIRKAQMYGIELRHVKRIAVGEIETWAPVQTFFYSFSLARVSLTLMVEGANKMPDEETDIAINRELCRKHGFEQKFLKSNCGRKSISPSELFCDVFNFSYSYASKKGKFPEIPTGIAVIISYAGTPLHYVETSLGKFEVLGLAAEVTFHSFNEFALEPTASYHYANETDLIVRALEFNVNEKGQPGRRLSVYKQIGPEPGETFMRWGDTKSNRPKT